MDTFHISTIINEMLHADEQCISAIEEILNNKNYREERYRKERRQRMNQIRKAVKHQEAFDF